MTVEDGVCDLLKLFVEPAEMGRGIGAALFAWAVSEARRQGARLMTIEADPDAEAFYRKMGARTVGTAPSGSVPGRSLPMLAFDLTD
ncbi:MAG: GNAT family N-acetyltransferase [Pseudomonadota bacterium]